MSLPALLGGPPARPQGPPSWPFPDEDVLAALQSAYGDGSWGKYQGVYVERLQQALQAYFQVPYVLSVSSGTFAVELALRALKVGPGDEVVLSAYDYPGNFLAVHAVGAVPVLLDVNASNGNLEVNRLPEAFGPATRALLVSHLHGGLVPMREVMEQARERHVAVIEDAAQSPGAVVQGQRAGAWGDVGILSFGGSKLLTAGRGGALLTRHADVHQRARVHLNRGNLLCPLSELQAAVLVPQLAKLDQRNERRAANVRRLRALLADVPGLQPFDNRGIEGEPAYYKAGFRYDAAAFGLTRDHFVAALRAEGVAFDEGFRALHVGRSPQRFRAIGDLSAAGRAHRETLVLHHPVLLLEPEGVEEVAATVRKTYLNAERLNG